MIVTKAKMPMTPILIIAREYTSLRFLSVMSNLLKHILINTALLG